MNAIGYRRFSVIVLVFNLLVVLWGAVVRATGSGDGCGQHWPKCGGEIIPTTASVAKMIEFTHRVSSGFAGLAVFILAICAFRLFEKKTLARRVMTASTLLMIIECLVGAALVLFRWVATDTSPQRAMVMSLHHVNTTLLIGALSLNVWNCYASANRARFQFRGSTGTTLLLGALGVVVVVVSGAITALADTLFKRDAGTAVSTLQRAFASDTHFLEKLRIAHPIISVSVTLFIILGLANIARKQAGANRRQLSLVASMFIAQLFVGALNVMLGVPVWMQIVHLALSTLTWVSYIFMSATLLTRHDAPDLNDFSEGESEAPKMEFKEAVRAYISLTKPRVISLLLFTTIVAMVIANGGWPPFWLVFWVSIGGYMAAGSANAINMVIDRDIDGKMARTAKRPTVTQSISSKNALIFAICLEIASFAMITLASNALAAMLALAGLLFYVFIYTLLLKRRTWQNIVIGGAAGAFPPLVGWAAVAGELSGMAWFLFALIFLWTPVHFWALALMIKDEYAEVGVPMLPVVRGERATVVQITAYAVLTALLCAVPAFIGELGYIYAFAGLALNLVLVGMSVNLMRDPSRPRALKLFKYSMLYLALVFVAIAVDRSVRPVHSAEMGNSSSSPRVELLEVRKSEQHGAVI